MLGNKNTAGKEIDMNKFLKSLKDAKKKTIDTFKKINIKSLIPRSRKVKQEKDKQHGFTFRNEKKKGKWF